jgi:hypothetical protein
MLANIAIWTGLFWFLGTHPVNRKGKHLKLDWTDTTNFLDLLGILFVLGLSFGSYTYYSWLCSSFSNEPSKLGRSFGYMTAVRMTGLAVAFGLDSSRIPFMVEAQVYFVLIMVGGALALTSSYRYLKDTKYGEEDLVIIPSGYETVAKSPLEGPLGDRKSAAIVEVPTD